MTASDPSLGPGPSPSRPSRAWAWIVSIVAVLFGGSYFWRAHLGSSGIRGAAQNPTETSGPPAVALVPSESASAVRTSTKGVVYVVNSSTHTLTLFGIDFNESGTKILDKIPPRKIGQIRYEGFDHAILIVEVYENEKLIFQTPIEDFSGGSWVWAFDGQKARRTQDLNALPKLPPGEK